MADTIERISALAGSGADEGGTESGKGWTKRMLNRQRMILALLNEAGGSASKLCATKWAFLLREETRTHGGPAFYQFLPYKWGPFSFCLYQEATALERDGYISTSGQRWELTRAGASAARRLDGARFEEVANVIRSHGTKSADDLMEYAYRKYPWFTVNSERQQLARREDAEIAVYTAGYERLLLDGFLDGLMRRGIRRIIDVRSNPVSRRYGFHKSTLSRVASSVQIDYVHVPELGIASDLRKDLDAPGARETLFDHYESATIPAHADSVLTVADFMKERPSVLVCMEACHHECHRSRLADAVAVATGLPVCHLDLLS